MMRIRAGLAAGMGLAACLNTLPAAAQYPGYSNYRPHTAGWAFSGTNDPTFGYQPRSSLAHPFGPDPGGGDQHEGRSGVDQ